MYYILKDIPAWHIIFHVLRAGPQEAAEQGKSGSVYTQRGNIMIKEILLLGNERLYQPSTEVRESELESLKQTVVDLHDTLMDFRETYHAGRAVAAPQIGVHKRMIYMSVPALSEPGGQSGISASSLKEESDSPHPDEQTLTEKQIVFINPVLSFPDEDKMDVMDDCMSFPGLLVRVERYKRCVIRYKDENWQDCEMKLEGDLSELLQHEYDHLDGILAVMRAKDQKSLFLKDAINHK